MPLPNKILSQAFLDPEYGNFIDQGVGSGVFNVKGYGAVGDGVTDDTAAIQEAINAAETLNASFSYLQDAGAVTARSARVYIPAGTFVHTGLTVTSTTLEGNSPSTTFLVHEAPTSSSDAITVGDGGTTQIYDVVIRNLAIVGDGNLTRTSDADSENITRNGVRATSAIYKCLLDNVTISQCQVGAKIEASWTFYMKNVYIFNCPKCLDWGGGHGGGEYCRFDAVYNAAAGASDHCAVFRYDTVKSTQTAGIHWLNTSFQAAGKCGIYGSDLMSLTLDTCLIERCNKEDDGNPYVLLADDGQATPSRYYHFINTLWTPAGEAGAASSNALEVEKADVVILTGGSIKESSSIEFAKSIVTGADVELLLLLGFTDDCANGKTVHADTAYHDLSGIPVFDNEIRIEERGTRLWKLAAAGGQFLVQNITDGEIVFSWASSGQANFRENSLTNFGGLTQNAAAISALQRVRIPVLTAEPSSAVDGEFAYADGSSWNPGAGAGFYGRQAGAWVKL